MKSLAVASIAVSLLASAPAFAAPCTTANTCDINSLNGTTTLSPSNPLAIEDQNVSLGSYFAEGTFSLAGGFPSIDGNADVAFDAIPPGQSSVPTGFANLTIEFFQDMTSLGSFQITDGNGIIALGAESFMLTLISASDVMFRITGTAFRNSGAALPDYNFNLSAIPIPGALPLLLSGLAGLGFAARVSRKRLPAG